MDKFDGESVTQPGVKSVIKPAVFRERVESGSGLYCQVCGGTKIHDRRTGEVSPSDTCDESCATDNPLAGMTTEELLAQTEQRAKDIYVWDLPEWAEIRRRLEQAKITAREFDAQCEYDAALVTRIRRNTKKTDFHNSAEAVEYVLGRLEKCEAALIDCAIPLEIMFSELLALGDRAHPTMSPALQKGIAKAVQSLRAALEDR